MVILFWFAYVLIMLGLLAWCLYRPFLGKNLIVAGSLAMLIVLVVAA